MIKAVNGESNFGVSAFSGLEYWSGVLEWSAGMEHWNGVLDWSAGGHDEYLWNYSLAVLPCQGV
jgi:hypothetical protein